MSDKLSVGTKVYYTGDMANPSGFGEVVAHRGPHTVDIRLEDGRHLKAIYRSMFEGDASRRFWTLDAWNAYRAEKIAEMEADAAVLRARNAI